MGKDLNSDGYYFELEGEYDIARRPELAAKFATITNGEPVTIDMTRVSYVDSTFLGELTAMRLRAVERTVTLVGVQPNVARIIALAKLDRFFTFRAAQSREP
jgi:anti-anti-sigma factor